MLVSALFHALRLGRHPPAAPPGCDPLDDPAVARMTLTELADLPFPRPPGGTPTKRSKPDGDLSATVSACRCDSA